jgi:1,4-dihydroxy-2-naphthoate octaprenyltransferase
VTVTNRWVAGARPRTLPAAVVPVIVGTGVAGGDGEFVWWRAALALVVALAVQVGTNYANDYSDGVRGTDDARVGPVRLVASGLAAPAQVKRAAWVAFAVAAVAGLALAAVTSWWLIAVGALCIAAGWLYTGGPSPYGYLGFGELFVFVFFGLVATMGTAYVQSEQVTRTAFDSGAAVGLLATALLVVNNLRDIPTDAEAGKRTLAVRMGEARTRQFYALLVAAALLQVLAVAAGGRPWSLLALAAALLAVVPVRAVLRGAVGPALIGVLQATARLELVFGVLLTVGLWLA